MAVTIMAWLGDKNVEGPADLMCRIDEKTLEGLLPLPLVGMDGEKLGVITTLNPLTVEVEPAKAKAAGPVIVPSVRVSTQ